VCARIEYQQTSSRRMRPSHSMIQARRALLSRFPAVAFLASRAAVRIEPPHDTNVMAAVAACACVTRHPRGARHVLELKSLNFVELHVRC